MYISTFKVKVHCVVIEVTWELFVVDIEDLKIVKGLTVYSLESIGRFLN